MALRISLLLYLVQVAASLAFSFSGGAGPEGSAGAVLAPAFRLGDLLGILVALVAYLWIAVAWHRYVLRVQASPGLVPLFDGERMLAYLGTLVLVALIFSLGAAAVLLLSAPILSALPASLAGLLPLVALFALSGPALRLSAALAGVAIEPGHGLAEGWAATRGHTGTLYAVGLLWAGVALAIRGVAILVLPDQMLLQILWSLPLGWIEMMVGISLLTTLYGHYVEGRPLV